jgi:hypothetical protein
VVRTRFTSKFFPVSGQDRRQAAPGGGFERADTKTAAGRNGVAHNICRVVEQLHNLDGVGQELLALGGENDAAAVATKERDAELVFEQAYSRRDVGLNGMQFFRRPVMLPSGLPLRTLVDRRFPFHSLSGQV